MMQTDEPDLFNELYGSEEQKKNLPEEMKE